jgi:energy-coupling factor transporter ATP-binding protein EcfA2
MNFDRSKLTIVAGRNFSGRSTMLRDEMGFDTGSQSNGDFCQYLGSDVANFISGVSATVREELALHSVNGAREEEAWLVSALDDLQIHQRLEQNPFTLSGGEQTLLTILSMLLRGPHAVALDCALEQLSSNNRSKVISLLLRLTDLKRVLIADNRLAEFDGVGTANRLELPQPDQGFPVLVKNYEPYEGSAKAVSVECLSFHYKGGKEIFEDASLTLEPGNVYQLLGENGAGKSTFSKLACGILHASAGQFRVDDVAFVPADEPSQVFAYHFQNPDLQLFSSTVKGEVELSARNKEEQAVSKVLKAFGLATLASKHPMDLSFSLRKRLALAVTFAMQRPWMILDEPTIGQDDETVRELAEIIKSQARAGTGIILISHSPSFLALFDPGVIEVRDSKLIQVQTPSGLVRKT